MSNSSIVDDMTLEQKRELSSRWRVPPMTDAERAAYTCGQLDADRGDTWDMAEQFAATIESPNLRNLYLDGFQDASHRKYQLSCPVETCIE